MVSRVRNGSLLELRNGIYIHLQSPLYSKRELRKTFISKALLFSTCCSPLGPYLKITQFYKNDYGHPFGFYQQTPYTMCLPPSTLLFILTFSLSSSLLSTTCHCTQKTKELNIPYLTHLLCSYSPKNVIKHILEISPILRNGPSHERAYQN